MVAMHHAGVLHGDFAARNIVVKPDALLRSLIFPILNLVIIVVEKPYATNLLKRRSCLRWETLICRWTLHSRLQRAGSPSLK
jgi:hypothetical protein